jgi:hypothetical protein
MPVPGACQSRIALEDEIVRFGFIDIRRTWQRAERPGHDRNCCNDERDDYDNRNYHYDWTDAELSLPIES